ncbi:MAG: ABC transporter permease [Bacteroidetes bacterium]|nr:ABC transporter permease [Bacteroidota bacterium]
MNQLVFVLRLLRRNPLFLFVNITGLGLAFSSLLLTLALARYEFGYDKHFATADRVVRLYNKVTDNTSTTYYSIGLREAYTQVPASVPEVEASTQIYRGWKVKVESGEKKFDGLQLLIVDKEFFRVFGLDLLYGNPSEAMAGEKQAVVSASTAKKIFNRLNCIGEVITMDKEQLTVTGVIQDLPRNSHFAFDVLASMQTIKPESFGGLEFFTYYLLGPGADHSRAEVKISAANNKVMAKWAEYTNSRVESGVEPLTRIYLHSKTNDSVNGVGNLNQLIIVILIAGFILIIALVSFINLLMIQGEKRLAEIATRKMFGAQKYSIASLFILETAVIFLLAIILAGIVTYLALPAFASLMRSKVELSDLFSGQGLFLMACIMLIIFLVSAGYPVLYLSRMNLVLGLRGRVVQARRKLSLSSLTILVQFLIASFFISSVVIIIAQLNYLKDIPPGFSVQNVTGFDGLSYDIGPKYESLKSELEKLPFVESAGFSDHAMGGGCSGELIKTVESSEKSFKGINEYRVKPGFCETMKFRLIEGRFFNDSENDHTALILNESAVKMLGLAIKPGSLPIALDYNDKRLNLVGVVKDFYYLSNPGAEIQPLSITNYRDGFGVIYIRGRQQLNHGQQIQVNEVIRRYDPSYVMHSFQLSDIYNLKFQSENRLLKMVSLGTFQVILISLIGLLALTIINVARRTREIGIRKVLGSSVGLIILRLMKETFILVAIAMFSAFLASDYVMNQWLKGYANRIHTGLGYFFLSGLLTLLVALIATLWQSWLAATRNPVEAIKHE